MRPRSLAAKFGRGAQPRLARVSAFYRPFLGAALAAFVTGDEDKEMEGYWAALDALQGRLQVQAAGQPRQSRASAAAS